MKSASDPKQSDQRFYTLTPGWATKYFFANVDTFAMGEASVRMSYRELASFRGTAELSVSSGSTPGDFIRNDVLLLVVSDKVIRVLSDNQIKRWATFSVKVRRGDQEIPGYHGLAILGRGGVNDSSLVEHITTVTGSPSRRISGLRPTEWDGSDLFTLDDMNRVALATNRVTRVFKSNRVTNCLFEPAEGFKVRY